jgi:hypothetical protein
MSWLTKMFLVNWTHSATGAITVLFASCCISSNKSETGTSGGVHLSDYIKFLRQNLYNQVKKIEQERCLTKHARKKEQVV